MYQDLKNQNYDLFPDLETIYDKEWQDMPEFVQEDLMPWKTLKVHFETAEDLRAFSEIVKQKILPTAQYIWYPEIEKQSVSNLRWVDES